MLHVIILYNHTNYLINELTSIKHNLHAISQTLKYLHRHAGAALLAGNVLPFKAEAMLLSLRIVIVDIFMSKHMQTQLAPKSKVFNLLFLHKCASRCLRCIQDGAASDSVN